MQVYPDRFWWLSTLVGILLVSFLLLLLGAALALTLQLGFSLGADLSVGMLMGTLFGSIFWLFCSLSLIRHGLHARADLRRRREAIHTNQQRMPLASISADNGDATDLAIEPLDVLWRGTPAGRRASLLGVVLLGLLVSGCCVLGMLLLIHLVTHPAYAGVDAPASSDPLSLRVAFASGWLFLLTVSASVLLVPLGGVVYWMPSLLAFRGTPNGVMARPDGLLYYPKVGPSRFFPWEELRLFEVKSLGAGRRYWLYGAAGQAEWSDEPPPRWAATLGMEEEAFRTCHQRLLTVIVERTHLQPRTLDKNLAKEGLPGTSAQSNQGAQSSL